MSKTLHSPGLQGKQPHHAHSCQAFPLPATYPDPEEAWGSDGHCLRIVAHLWFASGSGEFLENSSSLLLFWWWDKRIYSTFWKGTLMYFSYSEMTVRYLKLGYILSLGWWSSLWKFLKEGDRVGQIYFLSPLLSQIPGGPLGRSQARALWSLPWDPRLYFLNVKPPPRIIF